MSKYLIKIPVARCCYLEVIHEFEREIEADFDLSFHNNTSPKHSKACRERRNRPIFEETKSENIFG